MGEKFIPYAELDESQRALVDSRDWTIRCDAARQGYGLDKLVDDENEYVRNAVAEQGYGLEKLVDDPHLYARIPVARQGFGLDKLVDDPEWIIRADVARQGYGLDKLVDDEAWIVREAVAKQGYGLDKLVDDESEYVRSAVAGEGFALDLLVNDENPNVRWEVAAQGYGLDKLAYDENSRVCDRAVEAAAESLSGATYNTKEELIAAWAVANPYMCAATESRFADVAAEDAEKLLRAGWPAEEIAAVWTNPTASKEITAEMGLALVAARVDAGYRYEAEIAAGKTDATLSAFCFGEFWYKSSDGEYVCIDNTGFHNESEYSFVEEFKTEDAAQAWLTFGASYQVAAEVDAGTLTLREAVATEYDDPDKMLSLGKATWEKGRRKQPREEKGGQVAGQERKPGELKAAGDRPKQPEAERATPMGDEVTVRSSAAARAGEAPAKSSPEKRK